MLKRDYRKIFFKYFEFTRTSAREALANSAAVVGRSIFLALILLIFSRVWAAAFSTPGAAKGNPADMIWYLFVTEWIILSIPYVQIEIEDDVKTGNLAYHLPRPISYAWMKVAEGFGDVLVRLLILGIAGFFFALVFSGSLPAHPFAFLYVIPLVLLAATVGLIFQVCIGISAFWLQDSTPLFWVWQKLSFILGGLIVPLSLYPVWLKSIALATPFAALLYGPGETLLSGSLGVAALSFAALLFWLLVAVEALNFLFSRGRHALEVNGG